MAGLDTYRARRDFATTPEPDGRPRRQPKRGAQADMAAGAYVIQKHAARRLHYDLRLEMGGVLKSWAVTRGPSLVAGEKRLAVQVEDHPLAYGGFEGTIPPGQYGSGNVIVWDRGTWTPVGDAAAGYHKGHLEFEIAGEKLHGRWHLVRMAPRAGEKKENWLLIKAEDAAARPEGAPEITEEAPLSGLSGRDVAGVDGADAPVRTASSGSKRAGASAAGTGARKPAARKPPPAAASARPPADARVSEGAAAARKTGAGGTPTPTPGGARASALSLQKSDARAPASADAAVPARRGARSLAMARRAGAAGSSRAQAAAAPVPFEIPKAARKAPLPDFVLPALATLASRPPAGRRHVHEIKFDGYRLQARLHGGRVRLITRTGLDWTDRFGARVRSALEALPVADALIDGEVVVEAGNGASDFTALQADLSAGRDERFIYYAFDLLHLNGYDLTPAPLLARKMLLERLVSAAPESSGALRCSAHFEDDGALVLQHACRLSLEGVISKLKDAPYHSGRSRDWIKSKCSERQEFVVGGFVPSTTARRAIGSLVLGVYEGGRLVPVGRVGTGFSNRMAADLHALLAPDAVEASPFAGKLSAEEARDVVFVAPRHVAEVEFRAWTGDGHLRHASFRGLRDDKPATEIVREAAPAPPADDPPPKRRVRLTHPDRVYWPDTGVTKEGLADYYAGVWRFIAPFVVGRPLALVRCPEGIEGPRFFQKHPWKGADKAIRAVADPRAPGDQRYLAIDTLDGLMALVQGAALEIHPFGAPLADWERPDMLVMDLDPGEGVDWEAVIAAAREVKARLEAEGLAAFVKTSGGKGLHVCTPLVPKADWAAAKAFTKAMAEAMAADAPERFVATIAKAKRTGRILVDYLRNQRGATAVAAYSARARAGAPVSMPLGWEELGPAIGPQHFTVLNAPSRLAHLGADPWADFRAAAVPLPDAAVSGSSKRARRR